jgi:hypothetical protein
MFFLIFSAYSLVETEPINFLFGEWNLQVEDISKQDSTRSFYLIIFKEVSQNKKIFHIQKNKTSEVLFKSTIIHDDGNYQISNFNFTFFETQTGIKKSFFHQNNDYSITVFSKNLVEIVNYSKSDKTVFVYRLMRDVEPESFGFSHFFELIMIIGFIVFICKLRKQNETE